MRAGVSRKWVYEFEAGKPTAELRLILRTLDVLGLTLELGYQEESRETNLDSLIEEHRAR